jgi:RNA polymerase sigma factor (sigma-70 family)
VDKSGDEQRIAYASLLAGIYAQDRDAWAELHTEFYRRLLGLLCTRFRMSTVDAEEVAADTIHAALVQLQRYSLDDPLALPKYLWVIARRAAMHRIRDGKCTRQLESLEDRARSALEWQYAVFPVEQPSDQLKQVREAITQLSERDRQLLEKFYFQELPKEQIMAELGISATQFRLFKTRAVTRISAIIHNIPSFIYKADGRGTPTTQKKIRQIRKERNEHHRAN